MHSFILPLSSWTGWGKHGQLWQRRWPVWWQCWHPGKQTPLCLLVGAPMATRKVVTHWHPETLSGLPSSVHCGNCSFLRMPYRLIPIWTGVTPSIDAHACTIQSLSLSHWGCLVALLLQPYCKWGWEKQMLFGLHTLATCPGRYISHDGQNAVFCRSAMLLSSIQVTEHWLCRVQRQMGDSSVSFSNVPFWSQRTHPASW